MSIPYIFAEFSTFSNYEALIYPKKTTTNKQTNKQTKKQTYNFKVMVNRISKILRF